MWAKTQSYQASSSETDDEKLCVLFLVVQLTLLGPISFVSSFSSAVISTPRFFSAHTVPKVQIFSKNTKNQIFGWPGWLFSGDRVAYFLQIKVKFFGQKMEFWYSVLGFSSFQLRGKKSRARKGFVKKPEESSSADVRSLLLGWLWLADLQNQIGLRSNYLGEERIGKKSLFRSTFVKYLWRILIFSWMIKTTFLQLQSKNPKNFNSCHHKLPQVYLLFATSFSWLLIVLGWPGDHSRWYCYKFWLSSKPRKEM